MRREGQAVALAAGQLPAPVEVGVGPGAGTLLQRCLPLEEALLGWSTKTQLPQLVAGVCLPHPPRRWGLQEVSGPGSTAEWG